MRSKASYCYRFAYIVAIVIVVLTQKGIAQTAPSSGDSYEHSKNYLDSLISNFYAGFLPDSILKKLEGRSASLLKQYGYTAKGLISADSSYKAQFEAFSRNSIKPAFAINGGFLGYEYAYRSNLDTPYAEQNISQHMISAGLDVTLAAHVPVRITYYGRYSNSNYFRDYSHFKAELNTAEFRRVQQNELEKVFNKSLSRLKPAMSLDEINSGFNRLNSAKNFINSSELQNALIFCTRLLMSKNLLPFPQEQRDSLTNRAQEFLDMFQTRKGQVEKLEHTYDSLQNEAITVTKSIIQLQNVFRQNRYTQQGVQVIKEEVQKAELKDERLEKLLNRLNAIRTFAVGRTMPNMSNLSVKNINVGGINFEYNANGIYAAVTAGSVDFRIRDFVSTNQKRIPQSVYAASLGVGLKEANHLILTGYGGQKQILSPTTYSHPSQIFGLTLEAQYLVTKNIRVIGELAQSTTPVYFSSNGTGSKPGFVFGDKSNKAYYLQLYGFLPKTATQFAGAYQYQGINFQNFSSYRTNANTISWNAKMDQYIWKHQLHLTLSLKKNDFSNPYVLQNYNTNAVFKTLNMAFRKRGWPTVSVGYIPSSQFTIIDQQVYENRYQVLNASLNHNYKILAIPQNTSISFNKFYNRSGDTSFIYNNASSFFLYHRSDFKMASIMVSYSSTFSGYLSLDVLEESVTVHVTKYLDMGFGAKINNMNHADLKIGPFANGKVSIPRLGDINFWYESGRLPGSRDHLEKSEWFNIGYMKYFRF